MAHCAVPDCDLDMDCDSNTESDPKTEYSSKPECDSQTLNLMDFRNLKSTLAPIMRTDTFGDLEFFDMWGSCKKRKLECNKAAVPNIFQNSSSKDEFVVPTNEEDPCVTSAVADKIEASADEVCELPIPTFVDSHEDGEILPSPENLQLSIEHKFLVEMPDDFFDFWDCCTQLNKEKPEEALSKAGLTLVGPYDVLTGKLDGLKTRRRSSYACHWRYYYDPPEFMTVIAGDEKEYHIGYYRDDPFEMPSYAGSVSSVKQGIIRPLGGNIFAAVCSYLREKMREENPFKKAPLQRLYNEVEMYAKKKNHSLEAETKAMKERKKYVVSQTFHGGGIVAYYDKDNFGYREIPTTNAKLRRMLQRVVDARTDKHRRKHFECIQELIKQVQYAYDDDDIGTGLELGLNMFTFGHAVFHKPVYHVLGLAYDILGRDPYIDILQAHLKNRRRGANMSILEVVE